MHRLRLKYGVPPAQALAVLREAAQRGQAVGHSDAAIAFNEYRAWVEGTEGQLASLTLDPATVTMLLTRRHFLIQEIGPNPQRLWGPLYAERDRQVAALEALAADLEARIARAQGGEPTVLDTNTVLHYQRPDSVPWIDVIGRSPVRLVVPLRVVEELDAKKYGNNVVLAQRAQNVLPWLETTIRQDRGIVRPDTSIEVPIDTARRVRPDDAGSNYLTSVTSSVNSGGQRVMLVTGDTALRLRADAAGIPASQLDDKYLRVAP